MFNTKINIDIPSQTREKLLSLGSYEDMICKYGEDIYYCDWEVEEHIDNTPQGKDTILLVLINTTGFVFWQEKNFEMLEGTILRFDGNKIHSLHSGGNGRFVCMMWDVPIACETSVLISEMEERLVTL
jgi:hypothetical protein